MELLKSQPSLVRYELHVFTDNPEDLPLILGSDQAFILTKNRNKTKWNLLLQKHPNAEIWNE